MSSLKGPHFGSILRETWFRGDSFLDSKGIGIGREREKMHQEIERKEEKSVASS